MCTGLPAEFMVDASSASRMLPLAMAVPGSASTTASLLTSATKSARTREAPRLTPPANPRFRPGRRSVTPGRAVRVWTSGRWHPLSTTTRETSTPFDARTASIARWSTGSSPYASITTPTVGRSAISRSDRAPRPPTLRQHQRADHHDHGGHRAVQHRPRRTSGERPLPEAGHNQRPEADRPSEEHHPFGPQRQERLGRGEGDHERGPGGCDQGDHVPVDAEVRTEHHRHERCAEQPYRDRAEHPKGHGRHPHQLDPMSDCLLYTS